MSMPTGKLAFAYQSIAALEQKLADARAELAALKAGQGEAVAWVIVVPGTTFKSVGFGVQLQDLPVGTELYAARQEVKS